MQKRPVFIILLFINYIFLLCADTPPHLKAEAAVVVDVDTHEIIYAKDMDRQMYPASLTKLLTALLLAEYKKPGDVLVYSAAAKAVDPYKLDLLPGEELYARDAMSGLLLFSANDIAYMIAENIAGDVDAFAGLMNEKAESLHLTGSHFVNPHGLHDDNHYSTAYDLSVILREICIYPWIMETTGKKEDTIITLMNHRFEIMNRNKLVQIEGCIGGKTGWTPEAGRNLAALYERESRRLAAVVLKSEYDRYDTVVFQDMGTLIDWAYARAPDQIFAAGETVRRLITRYKLLPYIGPEREIEIPVVVNRAVLEYTADPGLEIKTTFSAISVWKLNRAEPVGALIVSGREIQHKYLLYPTFSAADIFKKGLPFYGFLLAVFFFILTVSLLLRSLFFKPGKTRKAVSGS